MNKKKKPRFFCDNCGYEVSNSAKSCPHCGRFFSSVRCPVCGFSGDDGLFQTGCPLCGYSDPAVKKDRSRKSAKEVMPAWAYIISVIVLLVIVAFLSHFITK
jgi:predicted RNA-binding Zn-ribbon protein involved in translation (DUF1610 family)